MTTIEAIVVSGTKCDFCSDPNAVWEYPARTYQVKSLGIPVKVNSIEQWLACETCHGLIGRGNWRGLAERSVKTFDFGPIPVEVVMALHQEFRANWIGPARKVRQTQKPGRTDIEG